jgi:tRNA threonylcarbamoyladenosine modification (KEOPS) complex Cgi121 subunit
MERNPQSIVFSIIGRINALAGTDQIENVLKIDIDTGNVEIVQLIVGTTYCSNIKNFLF